MGRKRRVLAPQNGNVNEVVLTQRNSQLIRSFKEIMRTASRGEVNFRKCSQQLRQLFEKLEHNEAMRMFINALVVYMNEDESNEIANTNLKFCANFMCSYHGEVTQPFFSETLNWVLSSRSHSPHIRYRLCQFVNTLLSALGSEAALDDHICDQILDTMLYHLRDVAPNVRVQAINAMHRLQVPENPDDAVLRAYQFHLCSDPSPRVRCAVLDCMGRNYNTIPYMLDRLRDIDDKVRRHTYLGMSSYPVRSFKVAQRVMLLENGLNERSEMVRKSVVNIMLKQWIESYHGNVISLVAGLRMDASHEELERFRKVAKQMLEEIFTKKQQTLDMMLECLPIVKDGEFHHCVPHDELTLEVVIYWQSLMQHMVDDDTDVVYDIVPELSVFCSYIEKFVKTRKADMDSFEVMEYQYILLSLLEMAHCYDLSDEVGRDNLKTLLENLLEHSLLDENAIKVIIKCAENLITNQAERMQFFVDKIRKMCGLNSKQKDLIHDRNLINNLLANSNDDSLKIKLSTLKVKILDLEEQEMNYVKNKNYGRAQQITDEKNAVTEQYTNLLKPLLEKHPEAATLSLPFATAAVVKNETILKCLQIAFHLVVSPKVCSLDPQVCQLYKDYIGRQSGSNNYKILNWALKCGAAFSMFYETIAKDVYDDLYSQFSKNYDSEIWKTAISSLFTLLARYGIDHFVAADEENKSKKSGRQLYTSLEMQDLEDEPTQTSMSKKGGFINMMSHILDKCDDAVIKCEIVEGFARLVLYGKLSSSDIIEKLFVFYFNPSTDERTNQILGNFFARLIALKKFSILLPCLMPTISSVLSATYDSPLSEIRPDVITKFFIDATREDKNSNSNECMHNKLANLFLQEMLNNVNNKDLCKLLSKEILTLAINVRRNFQLKVDFKTSIDKLLNFEFDPKTIKNLNLFKDMVDGVRERVEGDPENEEDHESEYDNTQAATTDRESVDDVNSLLSEVTTSSHGISVNMPVNARRTTVLPTVMEVQETSASDAIASANTTLTPVTAVSESPAHNVLTTYGLENRLRHGNLRKSLNLARDKLPYDSATTRSATAKKIRIELRIDSDKKKPPSGAEKEEQRHSRAKKTLDYQDENATTVSEHNNVESNESNETNTESSLQLAATATSEELSVQSEQIENETITEQQSNVITNKTAESINENDSADQPSTSNNAVAVTARTPKRTAAANNAVAVTPRTLKLTDAANNADQLNIQPSTSNNAVVVTPRTPKRTAAANNAVAVTPKTRQLTAAAQPKTPEMIPPSPQTPIRSARSRTVTEKMRALRSSRNQTKSQNKNQNSPPALAKSPAPPAIPARAKKPTSEVKSKTTAAQQTPTYPKRRRSLNVEKKTSKSLEATSSKQAKQDDNKKTRSAIPRLVRKNSQESESSIASSIGTRSRVRKAQLANITMTRKRHQENVRASSTSSSDHPIKKQSRIPISKKKRNSK